MGGAIAAAVLLVGGCGGILGSPTTGGESHFLRVCTATCGGGFDCIAGVCTRGCLVGQPGCEDLDARAACTDQSVEPGAVAVCDVTCTFDADCASLGTTHRCQAGYCRGAAVPTLPPVPPDPGDPGGAVDAGPGVDASGGGGADGGAGGAGAATYVLPDPATLAVLAPTGECSNLARVAEIAWQDDPGFTDLTVAEAVERLRGRMAGLWLGYADSEWIRGTWAVRLELRADGSYSSATLGATGISDEPAFYYGEDTETPLKQWRLEGVTGAGAGFGEIDITFCLDGCSLPTWQGELESIQGDESNTRLRFTFTHEGGYAIPYRLWRACP